MIAGQPGRRPVGQRAGRSCFNQPTWRSWSLPRRWHDPAAAARSRWTKTKPPRRLIIPAGFTASIIPGPAGCLTGAAGADRVVYQPHPPHQRGRDPDHRGRISQPGGGGADRRAGGGDAAAGSGLVSAAGCRRRLARQIGARQGGAVPEQLAITLKEQHQRRARGDVQHPGLHGARAWR